MTQSLSPADIFASSIALDLRQTEHLFDSAGARLAETIAAGLSGRSTAGLGAAVGQKAFVSAARALHALTEARSDLVEAHGHAERDARRMGLVYSNLIPTESKPTDDETVTTRPTAHLAAA